MPRTTHSVTINAAIDSGDVDIRFKPGRLLAASITSEDATIEAEPAYGSIYITDPDQPATFPGLRLSANHITPQSGPSWSGNLPVDSDITIHAHIWTDVAATFQLTVYTEVD